MRRIIVGLIWIAVPLRAETAVLKCPPRWGEPGKPLVTSSEAAKAIFFVVEKDFFPRADKVHFPEVKAVDRGDAWSVFRTNSPATSTKEGEIMVSAGGGQLSLRIDKCNARISDVYFTR